MLSARDGISASQRGLRFSDPACASTSYGPATPGIQEAALESRRRSRWRGCSRGKSHQLHRSSRADVPAVPRIARRRSADSDATIDAGSMQLPVTRRCRAAWSDALVVERIDCSELDRGSRGSALHVSRHRRAWLVKSQAAASRVVHAPHQHHASSRRLGLTGGAARLAAGVRRRGKRQHASSSAPAFHRLPARRSAAIEACGVASEPRAAGVDPRAASTSWRPVSIRPICFRSREPAASSRSTGNTYRQAFGTRCRCEVHHPRGCGR